MNNSQHSLVTGGDDPFLPKLIAAINQATRIDIAVSFIRSSGLSLIKAALEDALEADVQIRIVTSGYLNITEPQALHMLMILQEKGAQVKIFESGSTAFHMKTYIFVHREDRTTKEGVAYVGSSNISHSALSHGLEWNLRLTSEDNQNSFQEICTKFKTLFEDSRAVILTNDWIDQYRSKYQAQHPLEKAKGGIDVEVETLPPVEPNTIQTQALLALKKSRIEGLSRGLVVMATGTGKTWLAALDCKAVKAQKVLFVAHREEILSQAEETFIRIFEDVKIGQYTGTQKDESADILFASIQTLGRQVHLDKFDKDYFDYIIVDEFHHAGAASYQRLLACFSPKFLLGLTATPDRTDRADILSLCDNNLVFENGMVKAINQEVLCPFSYFGIADIEVDYQEISWRNGKFDPEELQNQLATEARAEHAYKSWLKQKQRRTLAFCISTKHADFMADFFQRKNIRAVSVHSKSAIRRNEALEKLNAGTIDIIFSVDLFNEGVDLPNIDTVLMLRPTESKIIFLQQLGRGLRQAKESGKEKLVVLDMIGNHISFFKKAEALFQIGITNQDRKNFIKQIRVGSIELAEGCFVNYDLQSIDFLEQLIQSKVDTHLETYRSLRESLGRRPTASEFYLAGGSMHQIRQEYGNWINLLISENDLDTEAIEVSQKYNDFLQELEVTALSKSFKLVLMETFLDLDGFQKPPSLETLAIRSWHTLKRRVQLSGDLPQEFFSSISDDQKTTKSWVSYWNRNPVHAWLGKHSENRPQFFAVQEDQFTFHKSLDQASATILSELTQELVNFRYLTYEARSTPGTDSSASLPPQQEEGSEIPFFTDLRIACGFFAESPHERESIELTRLPAKYGKLNPSIHFIARAKGNSMNGGPNPICDGDHLLFEVISPETAGSLNGQLVAIETDSETGGDQYLLRKVSKTGPGQYELIALNPDYETIQSDESMRTRARFKQVIDPEDFYLHQRFMREEIPPLFNLSFNNSWQQGHVCPKDVDEQILLVTLNKRNHSKQHRYHDYFIDSNTFHWQSQNRSSPANSFGQKIINHETEGSNVHLFVRKHKMAGKKAAPFVYLGRVSYQKHTGAEPMNVVWKMSEPLSALLAEEFLENQG
jgi:superfamily II DNA or RNA helicase/SOS-response transcriptional repressor LexA